MRYTIIVSGSGIYQTINTSNLHKAITIAKQIREETNDNVKVLDNLLNEPIQF